MIEHHLPRLFWQGLIIGPNESEEAFIQRINTTTLEAPIQVGRFNIDWIPVTYSNRHLRIWEGGCSWIGEGSVTIQLRQALAQKRSLWGLYSKEEILTHEAIHAMRVRFEEPIFEELLAYRTSHSPFRRFFGPLFRAPWESLCAALLIAILPLFPLLAPLLGFGGLFMFHRLRKARRALFLTEAKLSQLFPRKSNVFENESVIINRSKKFSIQSKLDFSNSLDRSGGLGHPLLLGLTDREIFHFSTLSLTEILHYCDQQTSPRWRQLKATFLND